MLIVLDTFKVYVILNGINNITKKIPKKSHLWAEPHALVIDIGQNG